MKPSAKERAFHIWVMDRGCCVTGKSALFHHEKQSYPLPRRDHMFGVPLCHELHTELHIGMGWNLDKFREKYGVDLYQLACDLREKYRELRK